jgi:hypothetical protein
MYFYNWRWNKSLPQIVNESVVVHVVEDACYIYEYCGAFSRLHISFRLGLSLSSVVLPGLPSSAIGRYA